MPNLIAQVQDLSFRYPEQPEPLFSGVSFTLYQGGRSALLGVNGSGKTTLIRLLLGELEPEQGSVVRRAAPTILRQDDRLEARGTVLKSLLAGLPELAALHREMTALEAAGMADPMRYADVVDAFTGADGFELLARLEAELDALGFPEGTLDASAETLSGGEQRLLKLVATFLDEAELRVLDEPTNYLDARATDFLAAKLLEAAGACLLVSHDRAFLDRVATDVLELERGQLHRYRGNYSTFRAAREADFKERLKRKGKLEREIGKLREMERSYKVWGARKEKEKSGAADKGYVGARAAKLQKRSILAKERMAQRIEALEQDRPWIDKRYAVAFPPTRVPGGTCLALRELRHAYGDSPILSGVSSTIAWGERIALLGRNGAGKTTLIELLLGDLAVQAGEVLWGKGADIGYLPQRWHQPSGVATPSELFGDQESDQARTVLGSLGVGGELFRHPFEALSEGQKRKVSLVRLMLDANNVLILDEPTTHLDYLSVELLEEALLAYPGTVLLVSHDRYLRERVASRFLELAGGSLTEVTGNEA